MLTREIVIARIEAVHGNKFTFENFVYTGVLNKATFTCDVHGDVEIIPHNLINGQTCDKCTRERQSKKLSMGMNEFIIRANKIHNSQYDYSKSTYVNLQTKMSNITCNKCGKTDIEIRPGNHLKGHNHIGCSKEVKIKKPKEKAVNVLNELKKNNSKQMKEWEYSPDWSENDLTDGSYVGFIYLFKFHDGSMYVGSKQMYKRVKDVKKLKGDSIENGWRDYSSSSRIVNQRIADGEDYTRTILWGFPTMAETLFVESYLIFLHGLDYNLLNNAVLNKTVFPTGERKRVIRGIIQTIEEWLN